MSDEQQQPQEMSESDKIEKQVMGELQQRMNDGNELIPMNSLEMELKMVLPAYGKNLSQEVMDRTTGMTKDGTVAIATLMKNITQDVRLSNLSEKEKPQVRWSMKHDNLFLLMGLRKSQNWCAIETATFTETGLATKGMLRKLTKTNIAEIKKQDTGIKTSLLGNKVTE